MRLCFFLLVLNNCCFASGLLEKMSLEEKVGQVLMTHFHGKSVNDHAKILIHDLKIGSIIYYNWSNGLDSPKQIFDLSSALQELAKEKILFLRNG